MGFGVWGFVVRVASRHRLFVFILVSFFVAVVLLLFW